MQVRVDGGQVRRQWHRALSDGRRWLRRHRKQRRPTRIHVGLGRGPSFGNHRFDISASVSGHDIDVVAGLVRRDGDRAVVGRKIRAWRNDTSAVETNLAAQGKGNLQE
jgi:hypothetical protein